MYGQKSKFAKYKIATTSLPPLAVAKQNKMQTQGPTAHTSYQYNLQGCRKKYK